MYEQSLADSVRKQEICAAIMQSRAKGKSVAEIAAVVNVS
jgi:anthranilate phosphoribosyltransferase